MVVAKHISDPTGRETLDIIGDADKFNYWMYSTISPYCRGEILEIGSGTGNISNYFLKVGSKIHLSDIREEYGDALHARFQGNPNFKGFTQINLVEDNFGKYSQLFGRFDSVFFLNVLEHIHDHKTAIANANKLLKPGGRLIILVPSYPSLYCKIDKALGHCRRYTCKSLTEVIQDNGNSIIKTFRFNAAGIGGWLIFGKILRHKQIGRGEMKLFNSLVPLFKILDRITFQKIGLSIITVATK